MTGVDQGSKSTNALRDDFANAAKDQQLFSSTVSTFEFQQVTTPRGNFLSAAASSMHAAFLGGYPDWSRTDTMQLLYLDCLIPNSLNPRSVVIGEEMRATYESIKERGVHTAFEVCRVEEHQDRALMLSGHRRLALINKLSETLDPKVFLVPCMLDPRGVLTVQQIWEQLLSKNEGQVPPPPIDRAKGFVQYMNDCGFSQSQAAARLGIPLSTMNRSIWLLKLPEELHSFVNEGALKETTAFELTKHQGGPAAQVELAKRIMSENLKLPQIRMIVKSSKPSGPELPKHSHASPSSSIKANTDRDIYVGGDKRVHVRVFSDRAQLTGPELRQVLLEAHGKLPVAMGVHHESHLAEEEQAITNPQTLQSELPVSSLTFHSPAEVSRLFKQYFGSLVKEDGAGVITVPRDVAQAVTMPLTQEQLQNYDITPCQVTRLYTARHFGLERQSISPPVTVLQVALFWTTKIQELSKLNPGQPITPEYASDAQLDIIFGADRLTARQAISDLSNRLKGLPTIVSTRILFVQENAQKLGEFRADPLQSRNRELFFTAQELDHQRVAFGPKLAASFFAWSQEQKDVVRSTRINSDGPLYNLHELQSYCLQSMARLLENCGGRTTGNIGISQLKQLQICCPQQAQNAELIPAIDVYQSLMSNWESLGKIAESSVVR